MIHSSAILEINTKNFIHNYKYLNSISDKSYTGATIKANAYGLGEIKIFNLLYKNGCRHFFVATFKEAFQIRSKYKGGYIYILNGINKKNIRLLRNNNNIIPIINSLEKINEFRNETINFKKKIEIGLHLDTGINRLGININSLKKVDKNIKLKILLSHLSSADEKMNKYNRIQMYRFKSFLQIFKNTKLKSLSNSMGILLGKDYHLDLTRPGIALYGGHYNNSKFKKKIKPVIKLKAEILQIKSISKNSFIGYNQTFKTKRNMTIAIIGIGYADGIPRYLSNNLYVYYKDIKFKILGRISMDSITIDITKSKKIIKTGMFVEIINYKHDIEKFARKCNTISNEVLTSISNRVKRIYL